MTPEAVKPVPDTATPLMVTAAVPAEVKVSDCLVGVLRFTLPKDRLLVLRLSVGVVALSWRANVFVAPSAVPVRVAV